MQKWLYTGIILLVLILGFSKIASAQFLDELLSIDLAPSPSNGNCLTTDGTNNLWSTCASGGGGGGTDNLFNWNQTTNIISTDGASTTATTSFSTNGFTANLATITSATSTTGWFSSIVRGLNALFTNATSTNLQATQFGVGSDYITDITGSGLTITSSALTIDSTVVRGLFSETIQGLEYNSSTGVLSTTTGFIIPSTTPWSNLNNFLNAPSSVITAGDALTWSGTTLNFDGGNTPAGDLGGTWASPSVTDDSHAHTGTTLSGIDISDDTNLTADGTEIVLTGDALSLGTLLTFTSATTTNLAVTGTLGLFGNSAVASANALCIQLTGSSALCDGSDDGGGGGGGSNWLFNGVRLTPSTTAGIVINASSTISDLSVTNATTTNATTTNLRIGNSLSFAGVSGTSWTDFCTTITGGSGLCDGIDNTAAGGGGIATSTVVSAGNLTYWTSPSTVSEVATGTLTETITGAALSATRGLVGGSAVLSLDAGFSLASTSDFTRINTAFASATALNATSPITYTGTTGNFAIASGFVVPSTTPWSDVNNFYNIPSSRITAGTGIDWSGNTLNGVYTAGVGLTLNTEDFVCDTATASVFGCITAADWSIFNQKVASTSIDTSAEIANLVSDETGTAGRLVFSGSPTLTGTTQLDYITATSATTTFASTTNLTVSNAIQLFGGGVKTTANALCLQITGSAGLCDGDDATGGGGGGGSNWLLNTAGDALTPSTTKGIVINASSTISSLSMVNATITKATTTDLSVTGSINLFGSGAKTTNNALCIQLTGSSDLCDGIDGGGGGSSKWTDAGLFSYLTDTADDLVFGSTATSSAPFWWDVSATTSYIGNGGAGDSVITFGPTSSPWTIGFDDTFDSFTISSSTALGSIYAFNAISTTTVDNPGITTILPDNGYRVAIGNNSYYGLNGSIDHLVVNGRIRNNEWAGVDCTITNGLTQLQADGPIPNCYGLSFYEDGVGTYTGTQAVGYLYGILSTGAANDGAGIGITELSSGTGWMTISSNTPSMEVTARLGAITLGAASTSAYYIGISNEGLGSSATYETEPTIGCYFTASSSIANWRAICRTSATAVTNVDTGIASTTVSLGSGAFYKFRIDTNPTEVKFWMKRGSSTMSRVATISTNVPTAASGPMSVGAWMGRTVGTYTVNFHILDMNVWWRKLVPEI